LPKAMAKDCEVPEVPGLCNYPISKDRRCKNKAGKGTPHLGQEGARCHKHGGSIANLKHGRYSKFKHPLTEAYEGFLNDPDILSLNDELAKARTFLVQAEENMGRFESQENFLDCANKFLKTIADLASKAHKIEEGETYNINVNQMMYMINQLVLDIDAVCGDCPRRFELVEQIRAVDVVPAIEGEVGE